MKRLLIFLFIVCQSVMILFAEGPGYVSGTLMLNANFYQRDTLRGTLGPVYDSYLSGADSWLNVNYQKDDFRAGIRLDLFQNSILFNPTGSYSGQGIGMWYIQKQVDKMTITGGYFYDQFGSGIIFRSYEGRGLGIDNAILGLHLKYDITDNINIKAFVGKQKNILSLFDQVIKGTNIDWYLPISDNLFLNPGAAVINRTLDQNTMNSIVNEINSFPKLEDRFIPKYNMYAYSIYNNLTYKNFSWYAEYAYKTQEAVRDNSGNLINTDGSVIYTNASYSKKGFGTTMQFRRIDAFMMRTTPYATLLQGIPNYLPTFSRQNTYRLISRYNAIPQEMGEMAFQGDIIFTPKKGYTINISYADIRDLNNQQLYKEAYGDIKIKPSKKFFTVIGLQHMVFNKFVYQVEGNVVETLTPFAEIGYKLTNKKSLRAELQYQFSERYLSEDFGRWAYMLLEYNIAPTFSFSVSDMYNIDPWRDEWANQWEGWTEEEKNHEKDTYRLHFPTISGSFTKDATKLTVSYVKQVAGVVCTGGVCRFQPAFSGVMASLLTSF